MELLTTKEIYAQIDKKGRRLAWQPALLAVPGGRLFEARIQIIGRLPANWNVEEELDGVTTSDLRVKVTVFWDTAIVLLGSILWRNFRLRGFLTLSWY